MSLENQGVFQLLKEVTFRRILVFLQLVGAGKGRGVASRAAVNGNLGTVT